MSSEARLPAADPTKRGLPAAVGRGYTSVMSGKMPHPQMPYREAKFALGQVVRHRLHPFRGVIFDVDPVFANTEDWWLAIPAEMRPSKDQPFYHLLAENQESEYIAYVSEQNLLPDTDGTPLRHPQIGEIFERSTDGSYQRRSGSSH